PSSSCRDGGARAFGFLVLGLEPDESKPLGQPTPTNHSAHPTRNVCSHRGQRRVCGVCFTWARLRHPGHTAYFSPHCAARPFASDGRETTLQHCGGAVTFGGAARGPATRCRLPSSKA